MKEVEILIVGQGLAGTLLSWNLRREGCSFCVIDDPLTPAASAISAGIINPVTGRRRVVAWMIDTLMDSARRQYQALEAELGIPLLREITLVDFFSNPQSALEFAERAALDARYLRKPENPVDYGNQFRAPFGYGEVHPCYQVEVPALLRSWRAILEAESCLLEERFDAGALTIGPAGFRYADIQARKLVFCDGAAGEQNPWFGALPFAPNKGEALIISAPGLPGDRLFKMGLLLAPLGEDRFWVGSSYQWSFSDPHPTEAFREKTKAQLQHWLKMPFRILDHFAAVRPATVERRPFVGIHPADDRIAILNGFGTKGCSLAPWFGQMLARRLVHGDPILPEADVNRFAKLLLKAAAARGAREQEGSLQQPGKGDQAASR